MTTKSSLTIGRRRLLAAIGAAGVGLPFFRGLSGSILRAQEALPITRFYFLFTGNGMDAGQWARGGETDFDLGPALEPLAPLREKLLLVRGTRGAGGHAGGMSEGTTGRPSRGSDTDARPGGGPSIDQAIAGLWRGTTPLASLETGVRPLNGVNDQTSYTAGGLAIPVIGAPFGSFNRVFSVTNEPTDVAEARRRRQRSVLDLHAREITASQARIGAESRVLLDQHLTLIRELEADLSRPYVPLDCDLPPAPAVDPQHIGQAARAQHDVIAAAFRCGTTRVATVRIGGWGGTNGYSVLGFSDDHHNVAHGGTSDFDRDSLAINRWHAEQFAYMASLLEAIPEGDGTMLDSSLLVWFNELGLGAGNDHGREDVPVVMAGGRRMGLKNGRFYSFPGVNYQHLLFTIARAVGGPEITRFGDGGTQLLDQLFA